MAKHKEPTKEKDVPITEEQKSNSEIQADENTGENENVAVEEKNGEQPEISEKDKEIEKLQEQLLRQAAEYDNYRKRTAKERLELEPEITAKVLSKLLPVLDNLDRALDCECSDPNFKKGVEMISESFLNSLAELGVEQIKTDNEMFNPNFHQAVQQVENDEMESGAIAQTFQKGYKLGDKIIRFAMVAVVS